MYLYDKAHVIYIILDKWYLTFLIIHKVLF